MNNLDAAALAGLPAEVRRPAYSPEAAGIGVVHLGVGNFFRAHQAAYLDDAMNRGAMGWGICGVSLRSPQTRDALQPQDGYYALIERHAAGDRARIIGSLRELLVAREAPAQVIARLAADTTRWVSLTITEKGYGHLAGSGFGRLDEGHPDIAHDLVDPQAPRSAVGLLHAAIMQRRRSSAGPLTILSCDNLTRNGELLRALLVAFDDAVGGGASAWIDAELQFPNSMVDRIVPRTTEAERMLARRLIGCGDAWPVVTEAFSQWVIEDRFAGPRPPLERSGVQIVPDVQPYETMKLRLLNAAHSALAWLAVPAAVSTVDQAIAQPEIRGFLQSMWSKEVIPGLDSDLSRAAPAYCASLLERFANPGLAHQTAQIAMDGSQKISLRILPSIQANLAQGLPIDRLAVTVAAWIRYLGGVDERGGQFMPDDPWLDRLQETARMSDSLRAAKKIISHQAIFGELAGCAVLEDAVGQWLANLRSVGSRVTAASLGS